LVVDDGSTDRTAERTLAYQDRVSVDLISHGKNRGLGVAVRSGLTWACNHTTADDDVVITMDADNTHSPALIPALVDRIKEGYDVVIASRYALGGVERGLSVWRRLLSRGASMLLTLFFPIAGARDYTCGFRAYRASALRRGFEQFGDQLIEETGFTCMAELLIKLASVGCRVTEVPLTLRYDLKSGVSKMKVARTILRYGRLIARRRLLTDSAMASPTHRG
jgi:dolichol-phosphate mannosyltransferase